MGVNQAHKNKPQVLDLNHNLTLISPLPTLRFQRPDTQHVVLCLHPVMPPHQFSSTISPPKHRSSWSGRGSLARSLFTSVSYLNPDDNMCRGNNYKHIKQRHRRRVADMGAFTLLTGQTRCLARARTHTHTR